MRIALIADIHGNSLALETVLSHTDRQRVDQVVCLGDIAALGPDPARCVDLVATHAGVAVLGNTDDWLLRIKPGEDPAVSDSETMNELAAWARAHLTDDHIAYLQGLPRVADLRLSPATTMQVFHGTPRSFDEVISATTPADVLEGVFGEPGATILAGGHTHVQVLRRFGARVLVNPGSVGLPGIGPAGVGTTGNDDVHWAEYAVVESSALGTSFEFHRLPISVRQIAHIARTSEMPALDWWMRMWRPTS